LVVEHLQHHGYTVQARNWHCPEGEVDIVAVRASEWFFVEVRTRRGRAYGTPEQSITPRKRARMETVARRYLGTYLSEREVSWHLGFAAVELDRGGHLLRITVYPDLNGPPLQEVET
jgi:putative endonuclease